MTACHNNYWSSSRIQNFGIWSSFVGFGWRCIIFSREGMIVVRSLRPSNWQHLFFEPMKMFFRWVWGESDWFKSCCQSKGRNDTITRTPFVLVQTFSISIIGHTDSFRRRRKSNNKIFIRQSNSNNGNSMHIIVTPKNQSMYCIKQTFRPSVPTPAQAGYIPINLPFSQPCITYRFSSRSWH